MHIFPSQFSFDGNYYLLILPRTIFNDVVVVIVIATAAAIEKHVVRSHTIYIGISIKMPVHYILSCESIKFSMWKMRRDAIAHKLHLHQGHLKKLNRMCTFVLWASA